MPFNRIVADTSFSYLSSMKELSAAPHRLSPLFSTPLCGLQWFVILCSHFHAALSQTISSLSFHSIWSVKSSWTFTICSVCPCSVQSSRQNRTVMKTLDLSLQWLLEMHSKGQTAYSRHILIGLSIKAVIFLCKHFFTLNLHLVMWTQVVQIPPQGSSTVTDTDMI